MILENINKSAMLNSVGRPVTTNLFIEYALKTKDIRAALYTARRDDYVYEGNIYPSLWKLYIDYGDPSEYYFACHYFLSPTHWKEVSEGALLKPIIEEWRKELELKIKADSLRYIIQSVNKDGKDSLQAAKYLLTNEWSTHSRREQGNKRGRPSNAEIRSQAILMARDDKAVLDDYARLTLNPKFLGN